MMKMFFAFVYYVAGFGKSTVTYNIIQSYAVNYIHPLATTKTP